jgi:4-oxalocrotonate tautomerase
MPLVNIKVLKEDRLTPDKKAELIARVTETVADALGKNAAATWVTIDEVSTDNWGIGGETLSARRERA